MSNSLILNIKEVTNDSHSRILDFPSLRQATSYSCGSSATQMVMAYYGIDEMEKDIIHEVQTSSKVGTEADMIVKYFRKHKFRVKQGAMTLEEVKKYIKKKTPVIIALQAWTEKEKEDWEKVYNCGHYVVAIGYTKDHIIFSDPSSVNKTYLTNEDFLIRWHDYGRNREKLINFGIVPYGMRKKFDSSHVIRMD